MRPVGPAWLDQPAKPLGSEPRPFDYFGGTFWARKTTTIFRASTGQDPDAWEVAFSTPAAFYRLLPCADGELLGVCMDKGDNGGVYRSTGAASGAPTWEKVLAHSGGDAYIHPWGIAGDGSTFIACEYAGPQGGSAGNGWLDSQHCWISVDGGQSWTVAYDRAALYGADRANSHMHGVAYDPTRDRFFLSEGHSTMGGLYAKDGPDGEWVKVGGDVLPSTFPTTLTVCEHGLVCGSDDGTRNGVWIVRHEDDPTDLKMEHVWQHPGSRPGNFLWAYDAHRDPVTDIAYIGYTSIHPGYGGVIVACQITPSGVDVGQVWTDATPPATGTSAVSMVRVVGDELVAYYSTDDGAKVIRGLVDRR